MTKNIIQTLLDTRIESPIDDVEAWVSRLTSLGDEIEHTRDVDPRLLTENEAEVIVRYYLRDEARRDIADAMGLSGNRVDRLRHAAEEDLLAAQATLEIVEEMRDDVQPER